MKFKVQGAYSDTGTETAATFDCDSAELAASQANAQGILVSSIEPASDAPDAVRIPYQSSTAQALPCNAAPEAVSDSSESDGMLTKRTRAKRQIRTAFAIIGFFAVLGVVVGYMIWKSDQEKKSLKEAYETLGMRSEFDAQLDIYEHSRPALTSEEKEKGDATETLTKALDDKWWVQYHAADDVDERVMLAERTAKQGAVFHDKDIDDEFHKALRMKFWDAYTATDDNNRKIMLAEFEARNAADRVSRLSEVLEKLLNK